MNRSRILEKLIVAQYDMVSHAIYRTRIIIAFFKWTRNDLNNEIVNSL
jgi:hypothetical protein